jgi:catechol 2,3-dioxygenase
MTTDMAAAPGIGRVTLTVHDLDGVSDFYEDVIGLHRLGGDAEAAQLGVGDTVLIELRRDAAARRHSRRDAGLFHTAFLLPARSDLGRWLAYAGDKGVQLQGASDHIVSEALYLADPEGNGIEIYIDRPRDRWTWTDGAVTMATQPLDTDDLLRSAEGQSWRGYPQGGIIGHVHLQVGALPPADAFYAGVVGLDITTHYPGATFYSWGGYHHHIAANIWNSRNAPPRPRPTTGLTDVEILVPPAYSLAAIRSRAAEAGTLVNEEGPSALRVQDPWLTSLTFRQHPA